MYKRQSLRYSYNIHQISQNTTYFVDPEQTVLIYLLRYSKSVYIFCILFVLDTNIFVYHSLNDGNLYKHDAETNDTAIVMDESIFVRQPALLMNEMLFSTHFRI